MSPLRSSPESSNYLLDASISYTDQKEPQQKLKEKAEMMRDPSKIVKSEPAKRLNSQGQPIP
jgi:hypothetical protein